MAAPCALRRLLRRSPRAPLRPATCAAGGNNGRKRRSGPRNRGRLTDPYCTPLRDGNRDRLYGLLTARAAHTLLVYLVETNKAAAQWFQAYMHANPIPYGYKESGRWADVSGEAFLEQLLDMPPENVEEKFRGGHITVDPPLLAQRLLEIRTAIAEEMTQDLKWVKEENADTLREACTRSLERSLEGVGGSLECDVSEEGEEGRG